MLSGVTNGTGEAPLLLLVGTLRRGTGLLICMCFSFIFLFILGFLRAGLNRMTLFLTVPAEESIDRGRSRWLLVSWVIRLEK